MPVVQNQHARCAKSTCPVCKIMKTITLWKLKAYSFSGEISPKREIKNSKFENEVIFDGFSRQK
jgi:hypothetical protein